MPSKKELTKRIDALSYVLDGEPIKREKVISTEEKITPACQCSDTNFTTYIFANREEPKEEEKARDDAPV